MTHMISLDDAIKMTSLYRAERERILAPDEKGKDLLPLSETFNAAALLSVLGQPGCVKIRIYPGMDQDKKVHAIIVGVDGNDEDILPGMGSEGVSNIIEDAARCPIICPPSSPLNRD